MPVVKKKHRSNPEWIRRHVTDPFVKAATQRGYRARSAYKLIEIDDKDRLMKPGAVVVDLGSTPGSWSQIARERLTAKDGQFRGLVVALDILPMDPVPEVTFIEGDFREEEVAAKLADALAGSAGKGTGLMAEKLGFDQLGRNGGAVDGDEWTLGARGEVVQAAGNHLLAGAGFAQDDDVGGNGGQFAHHVAQVFHDA